jgi:hypothetical protein
MFRILQESPERFQRTVDAVVGDTADVMRYVPNDLTENGSVGIGRFTVAEGKRRYAYILTQKGTARKASLTWALLVRKMEECEAITQETDGDIDILSRNS